MGSSWWHRADWLSGQETLLTVYSGKRNQEFPNLFLLDVMCTQFYDLLICPSTAFYLFFYFGFCVLNKFTHSKPKIWLLLTILQTTWNNTYAVFLWQVRIFSSCLDHDFNIFSSNSDGLYSDQPHGTSLQRCWDFWDCEEQLKCQWVRISTGHWNADFWSCLPDTLIP